MKFQMKVLMRNKKERKMRSVYVLLVLFVSINSFGQTLKFDLKTSPTVSMVFNTVEKYQSGLVQYNYMQLRIVADSTWDLYVSTRTNDEGEWDDFNDLTYSTSGVTPEVSLIQLRFRNAQNTSQQNDFFPLPNTYDPVYIIGSSETDAPVVCGNEGTNVPGDYITTPSCYLFNIDLMIKPGFTYRSGFYEIYIYFTLMENL